MMRKLYEIQEVTEQISMVDHDRCYSDDEDVPEPQTERNAACKAQMADEEVAIEPVVIDEDTPTEALYDLVKKNVAIILKVAKTGNLEPVYRRVVEKAAASIWQNFKILYEHYCLTEKNAKLQAENIILRLEVEDLRKEVAEMRDSLPQHLPRQVAQGSALWDDISRTILLQVDAMITERIEAFKDKLLPESREAAILQNSLTDTSVKVEETAWRNEDVPPTQQQPYWWTEEISELRRVSIAARRAYTRHRRRRIRDEAMESQLYKQYREAKESLQLAIFKSKTLGKDTDSDP